MKLFVFGEQLPQFEVPVLNEREVRASAGILFLGAFVSFMHAWLVGDFSYLRVFVIIFMSDFLIRLVINPKYSPTLILGRLVTQNQEVEYSGAPQKRFAWSLGLILALIMFWRVVINNMFGPINLIMCLVCLTLLFLETAFGICVGCYMYNALTKNKAKLCPGGTCKIKRLEPIQKVTPLHIVILILFATSVVFIYPFLNNRAAHIQNNSQNCIVPEWAIKMDHEEMYLLHHGCKNK